MNTDVYRQGSELKQLRTENSRLTSGLRELAEKWENEAIFHEEGDSQFDRGSAKKYRVCRQQILALLPEATKPSLATKEVPDATR